MNIDELVYDLKEHLDTYCQTYDDYDMTYNQTEMVYYLIKDLEKENKKYKEVIEKVIDYINDVSRHTDNYFDLDNNLWIREVEILDILKEVEHE